jgi:hypothetical protein
MLVIFFLIMRRRTLKQTRRIPSSSLEMSTSPQSLIGSSVESTLSRSSFGNRLSVKNSESMREVHDIQIKERLGGGYFSDVYRGVWEVNEEGMKF